MVTSQSRIESLASQIILHKNRYYRGEATIDDATYDALEEELRSLAPEHPALAFVGHEVAAGSKKISHIPPMLSLGKTYSQGDLLDFISAHQTICMDKIDGMALSIEYNDVGKCIQASTRGSGQVGENATEFVLHVSSIPKILSALNLPENYTLEVRGEVYFPISKFANFENQFDSYRNAVPGTFGRKDVNEAIAILNVLGFCAYEILVKDEESRPLSQNRLRELLNIHTPLFVEKAKWLEQHGFFAGIATESLLPVPADINNDTLAEFITQRFEAKRDYQIDGLVFRISDDEVWQNMGTTSHHPRGSLAFKQTGETAVTTIRAIEQAIGRSGKVTFRAQLEPVQLSGALISYATLHNAEFIEVGGYAPGCKVRLKRSGEVIPSIIGLEEASSTPYELPITCLCGGPLQRTGPDLWCTQTESCIYQDLENLVHFVSVIDVQGISDKVVYKLHNAGLLRAPSDLFRLTLDLLLQIEGFAQKSAENLLREIAAKRNLSLPVFLTALGIKRGGKVKCQEIAARFRTLEAVRAATVESILQEKGWAEKSASDFVNSLQDKSAMIDELLTLVTVAPTEESPINLSAVTHPLSGKKICITGPLSQPREHYKPMLERLGAKLVDNVTSQTTLLVCNEKSNSSKYRNAEKFGIPIVTEEELLAKLTAVE